MLRGNKKNKSILIKRFKSFVWRIGMVVLAVGLSFLMENLGLFGLPTEMVVIVGLVLGEVSKELNNKYDLESYLRPAKN